MLNAILLEKIFQNDIYSKILSDINTILTLFLLSPDIRYPAFANSVGPDQLASEKPADLGLHCLPFSM